MFPSGHILLALTLASRRAQVNDLESVRLLLEHGANPAAADGQGQTPAVLAPANSEVQNVLYRALRREVSKRGSSFPSAELIAAASVGALEAGRKLLKSGADPDSSDGNMRALEHACANRQLQFVQLLIDAGASVNAATSEPELSGPLHFAAQANTPRECEA